MSEPLLEEVAPALNGAPVPAAAPAAQPARKTRRQAFWFALRMMEVRMRLILVMVAAALIVGYWEWLQNHWDLWTRPAVVSVSVGNDSEFYCPMCPSVIRDSLEPNGSVPKCPICGMPLSNRKKGQPMQLPPGVVGRVHFSPERVRLAGIRTSEVSVQTLTREIRAVGTVTFDESRRARIVTRVSGYLEKLFVDKTFMEVCEGDPLAEIYSPDLYAAAQEMLITGRTAGTQLVEMSRKKLRLLGLDDREIDSIAEGNDAQYRLTLRAPHHGIVVRKEVLQGDSVEAGQVLFEVADLSTVWIEADVFEKDIASVRVGQKGEAAVEALPGKVFEGQVDVIYPELQTSTRTNRVRLAVDNSELLLRAGMYATVRLETPVNELEPFRTTLAAANGTGGDAEEIIARQGICPVTGAKLGSMGEPVAAKIGGRVVYLCCAGCIEPLKSRPKHYLARIRTVTDNGVLAVPEFAVVETGEQTIVYVEREPGLFEGVEVKLGPKTNGFYAVIEGLLPGDRVAAAGAFLVDAETRLNPAASAAYFGASGGPSGETKSSEGQSESTKAPSKKKEATEDDLKNVAKLPEDDRHLALAQKWCPVTNLPLGSMGVPPKIDVEGETVFLCCKGCEKRAQRDAARTIERVRQWRSSGPMAAERGPTVR